MYVIVGASSGVGRAIAEEFASRGHDLFLVSRELRDTNAVACDLTIRFGVKVKSLELDLAIPYLDFSKVLQAVEDAGKCFRGILFPAGSVIEDDSLSIEVSRIDSVFRVNCVSICALITEILRRAHHDCKLSIVGFGSIASIRGRGANMTYSAAKTALQFYFESLKHACAGRDNIFIQYYVLGYMDTNLAFAYNVSLPKGSPRKLAKQVYCDIQEDFVSRFYPRYWVIIAVIIKLLPWSLYKLMKF